VKQPWSQYSQRDVYFPFLSLWLLEQYYIKIIRTAFVHSALLPYICIFALIFYYGNTSVLCPNLLRSSTASFASLDLSCSLYYHKCILVFTLSICYICLILTKLNFGWQILVKTPNIKFHKILYRWELICFTQTDKNTNTCICSSFAKRTKNNVSV
jgi:hypothetical protein